MAGEQQNKHGKQPPPRRRRREFTKEFRRDAVELVLTTGRLIAEVARDLGIWDSTLGNWSSRPASTLATRTG
jgi:transposase